MNDNDLTLGVGPTRYEIGFDLPIFSGLGQFSRYILPFEKQRLCTPFHEWLDISEQCSEWRERARTHGVCTPVKLLRKNFDPLDMDAGRYARQARGFAQERRFLGVALDQMDKGGGLEGARDDEARETGT